MNRRQIAPLLFGLAGAAILISLGVWQLQRLAWKEGVLAKIEARIGETPVGLPVEVEPEADLYLPVTVAGEFGTEFLRVLVSRKQIGAGYRIITPLHTGERRILVDLGFVPIDETLPEMHAGVVIVTGNLHWPIEVDSFTPSPDVTANIWYARDVPVMAEALASEPILLVARETSLTDTPVTPLPVDTAGIPNDHLGYAITWFGLALVWLGMTAAILWRIRHSTQ